MEVCPAVTLEIYPRDKPRSWSPHNHGCRLHRTARARRVSREGHRRELAASAAGAGPRSALQAGNRPAIDAQEQPSRRRPGCSYGPTRIQLAALPPSGRFVLVTMGRAVVASGDSEGRSGYPDLRCRTFRGRSSNPPRAWERHRRRHLQVRRSERRARLRAGRLLECGPGQPDPSAVLVPGAGLRCAQTPSQSL